MNLDSIKDLLAGFEGGLPLLPDPGAMVAKLGPIARILVIAGPVLMVIMGLLYFFAAPKEANHHFGYRCYFGMGSEQAWQFTQRFAGITWAALGGILTIAMLIATRNFAQQDALEMLSVAARCVLWEAMVLLAASLIIRIVVAAIFDRHGERRTWKKSKVTE